MRKPGDSQFWTGLMGVKKQFLHHGKFLLQDGKHIRFWEDLWMGNAPLKDQYPTLYNIAYRKLVTVAEIVGYDPPNIEFRRTLYGDKEQASKELSTKLTEIQLNNDPDIFLWLASQSGRFTA